MKYLFLLVSIAMFTSHVSAQRSYTSLPESEYPYWPKYNYLQTEDLKNVQAQEWIKKDHMIEGWDWSLPESVEPSPRSLVGTQRNMGWEKEFIPMNLQFKANPVGILWVKWKDLEPMEGEYNFTPLMERIKQANEVGVDIILRVLTCSKERGVGKVDNGEAPLWLKNYDIELLHRKNPKSNHNYNPADPKFHNRYIKLVDELGKSGIPQMVKAAFVGYASHSFGDEGIGPYEETNSTANDTVKHVRERLDAWQEAFKGMEYKVFMGSPVNYGFEKGFGVRRGFVEMYLYRIPDGDMGQYIDNEGYLNVDENAPIMKYQCFNGEVNEEYDKRWATPDGGYGGFRFGKTTNSFPYRYFTSTLRALQMRCTYIHTTGHLVPQMLPFLSLELGRTVENAPDVWTFLRTSYLEPHHYGENDSRDRVITDEEIEDGIAVKNFERWLYQRDAPGYETTPALKINQAIQMWMVQRDKFHDFVARKGKKIGFNIDDRMFSPGEQKMAIKVSFYDGVTGTLKLVYKNNDGVQQASVKALGEDKIRTATFFIDAYASHTNFDHDFDLILESEEEVPVSFVRVVKTINNKK